jgi:hypothetical protein
MARADRPISETPGFEVFRRRLQACSDRGRSRAVAGPRGDGRRISKAALPAPARTFRSPPIPRPPDRRDPSSKRAGIGAHALANQVPQPFDKLVREQLCEFVAPLHPQDGSDRVELLSTTIDRVTDNAGSGSCKGQVSASSWA